MVRCIGAVLLITLAAGQQPTSSVRGPDPFADEHYGQPIDGVISAYPRAHGFQHGYEDGFHYGQWDRQMSLARRQPREFHEYRRARRGYSAGMGPSQEFVKGYRQGFLEGYTDAFAGASFKAEDRLREFGPVLAAVIDHAQQAALAAAQPSPPPAVGAADQRVARGPALPAAAVVLSWPGEFTWQSTENSFGTDLLTASLPAQPPAP